MYGKYKTIQKKKFLYSTTIKFCCTLNHIRLILYLKLPHKILWVIWFRLIPSELIMFNLLHLLLTRYLLLSLVTYIYYKQWNHILMFLYKLYTYIHYMFSWIWLITIFFSVYKSTPRKCCWCGFGFMWQPVQEMTAGCRASKASCHMQVTLLSMPLGWLKPTGTLFF